MVAARLGGEVGGAVVGDPAVDRVDQAREVAFAAVRAGRWCVVAVGLEVDGAGDRGGRGGCHRSTPRVAFAPPYRTRGRARTRSGRRPPVVVDRVGDDRRDDVGDVQELEAGEQRVALVDLGVADVQIAVGFELLAARGAADACRRRTAARSRDGPRAAVGSSAASRTRHPIT